MPNNIDSYITYPDGIPRTTANSITAGAIMNPPILSSITEPPSLSTPLD